MGRAKEILAGLETGSVVSESHKEEIPRDEGPSSISGADSNNEIQANKESENTKKPKRLKNRSKLDSSQLELF